LKRSVSTGKKEGERKFSAGMFTACDDEKQAPLAGNVPIR
jgi:hypothetical protein